MKSIEVKCIICGTPFKAQKRSAKFCTECKKSRYKEYQKVYKRIMREGKSKSNRPIKTDNDLKAIREKYKDPIMLDIGIQYLATVLTEEIIQGIDTRGIKNES